MSERKAQLKAWLEVTLLHSDDVLGLKVGRGGGRVKTGVKSALLTALSTMQALSGDASFRRYFRIIYNARSLIAVDAPVHLEDSAPFIKIAKYLAKAGIKVPEILAYDLHHGFMLISDLGDDLYLDHLTANTVEPLYAEAMDVLFNLQRSSPMPLSQLPLYDKPLLRDELNIFKDWFVGCHQSNGCENIFPTELCEQLLGQTFELLIQSALEQPQVFVHRDFHSRNLMLADENNPAVIDFQDAVLGPITYDLVSLLKDCYIAWPRARVNTWLQQYYEKLIMAEIISAISFDKFLQWFDWMGVQRHLKAAGIFSRLKYRDGKASFLQDIPRTLGYITELSGQYPPLEPFIQWLKTIQMHKLVNPHNCQSLAPNTRQAP